MKLILIPPGDKLLKTKASIVTDFDNKDYYMDIINQMKEICIGRKAFAAAATQFGIFKKMILVINIEKPEFNNIDEYNNKPINYNVIPYFNPKIKVMRGNQVFYESCMSVFESTGKVFRPYHIEFEYQDINGLKQYKIAEGFEAIILCHEIDHLYGIEYIDKAVQLYTSVNTEARIEIRKKHPYKVINKTKPFDQSNIDIKYQTKLE